MKKIFILILIAIICVCCQNKNDADDRISVFLEENELQMRMLCGWDIDYHPERKCWECKHLYSADSLLTHISVQVGKWDNVLSYNIHQLHEDSITTVQTVLHNIHTLGKIKHIYGSQYIDADDVYNNKFNSEYIITVGNDTMMSQVVLVIDSIGNCAGKHLYEKWYIIKNIDLGTRLSAYIEKNKSQMEMLRGWEILYVAERDCWWCRHWYNRDSLISFVLIRENTQHEVTSCEAVISHEDSAKVSQIALQNMSTLCDIERIYGCKFIGAYEVALFNDTLEYDYFIGMGNETTAYSIMLGKSDNTINGQHLYNNWYFKKKNITNDDVVIYDK